MSVVDVRDIASVAARVLTEPDTEGKTYDITGLKRLHIATSLANYRKPLEGRFNT